MKFSRAIIQTALATLFFIVIGMPASAEAASTLTWTPYTIDPETGAKIFGSATSIPNGALVTVPLNSPGTGRVSSPGSGATSLGVELFYIPDPELPDREFIRSQTRAGSQFELSWLQAGVYELDVYKTGGLIEVRGPVQRLLAWLFGENVYAAFGTAPLIDTIRFSIVAESEVEECCSSVVFLPGFAGSRLHTVEDGEVRDLWEPSSKADLRLLALNADGSSQAQIFVGDIVDSYFGLPFVPQIYQELIEYLNTLVTNESISEWNSYPYDWRQDVFDVVDGGTLRQNGNRDYLVPLIEEMASRSQTGKVSIVTHSNGGLVAKALMIRLEQLGKENLVDRLILVAVPQIGTPQGLVGLLHGKDFLPFYLSLDGTVRAVASTFPGAYGLLPSSAFYSELSTSTVSFSVGSVTETYRNEYQAFIDSIAEQFSFLINSPHTRLNPNEGDLVTPLSLSPSLLDIARNTHDLLDAWEAPEGVSVHEVAGWGNQTTHRVDYSTINKFMCPTGLFSCGYYESLDYEPFKLQNGDGTVVTASAHRLAGGEYFNLLRLANLASQKENRSHNNILGSPSLHAYLGELLGLQVSHDQTLFTSEHPADVTENIVVSVHSPLLLVIANSTGDKSGIFGLPTSDLYFKAEAIPGSSVYFGGEGKYVSVPKSGSYSVSAKGIGMGLFDLRVRDNSGNIIREFLKLPVQPNAIASLSMADGLVGDLSLDTDGNGSVDMVVDKYLTRDQAVQYCRDTIGKVQIKVVRLLLLTKLEILKNLVGNNSKFAKLAKEFLAHLVQKVSNDIPPERAVAIATCITALENSKK